MQGKIVLITGANRGIGKETANALAKKGATIVMACRDIAKGNSVCENIKQESGNNQIEVMELDLASLTSIREFAKRFCQRYQQLNVLINNAGIFYMTRAETQEGFEKIMGTNYLGPFLLTNLLLPLLKQATEARIINVVSNIYSHGQIDLCDMHQQKKYQGHKAYASSKLAIVLFTQELAERLEGTGITVNALHPGHAATSIWNIWPGKWYQAFLSKIIKWFLISPEEGAETSVYLASSDEVKGVTGKYFDKKKPKDVSSKCKDLQLQKGLWQLSEGLTGLV
ncbi:SDR family oxidoreductase [Chloroflexota bacterium]